MVNNVTRRLPRRSPTLRTARRGTLQVVGVAWYSPAAWVRLKNAVPDPELLQNSHARWLEVVTSTCAKLDSAIGQVVRIEVDADEFLAWCREQGCPAD